MMWAHTAVQSFGCVALYCRCTRIWLICLSLDVQPCSFNAHFDRPSIPCLFEGFEVFLRMHLAPSETLCISLYVVWAAISTFQVSLSLPHLAISGHCLPLIIWSLDAMNGIEMHWGVVGMCYELWCVGRGAAGLTLHRLHLADLRRHLSSTSWQRHLRRDPDPSSLNKGIQREQI